MEYKHALVTGGAGFIGSHIAHLLLKKNIHVTVLDNLSVGKIENIPESADFIEGDIQDGTILNELTKQCDIIFHQAARVSIRSSLDNSYEDAQTNLMGTLNILKACNNSAVKKIIFASSIAVYADQTAVKPVDENYRLEPISPYGISKLASEKYLHLLCKNANIDSVVLRYFNTYGPRQTLSPYVGVITIFINQLLKGESPVVFGDGEQIRDFVYVGDIARANLLAMKKEITNETVNIGTGIPTTVKQVAELLIQKIDPGVPIKRGREHPGELRISFPDISRAHRILGYEPKYKLENKIEEVIEHIRSTL